MTTPDQRGRILDLLREAPLIDGHNDVPWALREARERGRELDITRCPEVQTDLARTREGGLGGQFWRSMCPRTFRPNESVTQTLE